MSSHKNRLARIEAALEEQKAFVHRVPDPDTRARAEHNLLTLVDMRISAIDEKETTAAGVPYSV